MANVQLSAADAERRTPEAPKPEEEREPWEIDRARILHSAAFRRLQRKTQVFASGENDFFRTRLTHSLEVSQIAKGIAVRLGANPTLCEAASLAHDIGHPPFGHAGESVLNGCMRQAGGFEGNAQNLRVLATLEVKTESYEGLNLTRATLDAIMKYKTPYREAASRGESKFFYDADSELVNWVCQGHTDRRTSFESQIMDWSDDVAYSVHDLEDGMQAGLVSIERLTRPHTAAFVAKAVPQASERMIAAVAAELRQVLEVSSVRGAKAARKSWTSQVIHEMVRATSVQQVDDQGRGGRYAWRLVVAEEQALKSHILKALAFELVMREDRVASVKPLAEKVVQGLFDLLVEDRTGVNYPEEYRERLRSGEDRYRVACDFISGMTDDFAQRMFELLTS